LEETTEIGLASSEIRHLTFLRQALVVATAEGIYQYAEEEGQWHRLRKGLLSERGRFLAPSQERLWAVVEEGLYIGREINYSYGLEPDQEVREFLDTFSHEPTIHEIQKAAIQYAEVHPEKILVWRRAASRKAWLPDVSTGIDMDIDRNVELDRGGTGDPDAFIIGPDERKFNWDVSMSWDLGELIWNDDQTSIDVRSRLMVQLRDDVLDEVTRLYFERRRLQVTLLMDPPVSFTEKVEQDLRLQELTADIDALTGGYLSEVLARRAGVTLKKL